MSDKLKFVANACGSFRVGLTPDQAGSSPLLNHLSDKLKFVGQFLIIMTPPTLAAVTIKSDVRVGVEARFIKIHQFRAFSLA
jgi:hypothetical protein